MENKDLTVIIPLHEYNEEVEKLLINAVNSVPEEVAIIISSPWSIGKQITADITKMDTVTVLSIDGDRTSFQQLVNDGVKATNTKYFSILEFDDEYTPIWLSNAKKYLEYHPEVSVLMSLEDIIDAEQNKCIGSGNEAAWASSFSNEVGYIDFDCLQNFFDFYLTGSIFNKDDWNEIGGLKEPIKITFWYEFMLRLTHKNKKCYVMPKVCYNHVLGREGSLLTIYRDTVDRKEQDFWFNIAKKDYFYTTLKDESYYVYKPEGTTEE